MKYKILKSKETKTDLLILLQDKALKAKNETEKKAFCECVEIVKNYFN